MDKDKYVLITGGTMGIGYELARCFAEENYNLVLVARSKKDLQNRKKEFENNFGIKVLTISTDLFNPENATKVYREIKTNKINVDILVNNAGIAAFGTFNEMEVSQWSEIIQTNVMGMYYVTKEVLPYLINQNEGDIINVSSTAGLTGNASTSAYSASKFAVIGMSESLMKEVRKHNIRVCTLTPSTIASDMSIELGIATKESEDSVLQPEDFAELIVAGLKLPRRAMLKSASLWSTNP